MGIIHVLDSHLTNMIAAGEVVDRPVNIVKECVENALDAGASTIDIEVFEGGIEGVIISDDGCGMSREDLRMAFRRHATSKIQSEDELFAISTMGFRGEALPSIASVAKVSCLTSNGIEGSRIVFEYGERKAWEAADAPRGCRIEVRGLFLHTPARFKYLKKPNYEFSIIADAINKLALAHPEVRFTLKHDNRLVFQTSGRNDRREILYQMFGSQAAKDAVEFYKTGQDFTISGYAIQPAISRASRNYIYICLNGRTIRSWPVTKAVVEGYREYLPKDRFPICFINIQTDYQLVDVNVHPNKLEVRISKEEYLTQMIIETISELFESEIQAPAIKAKKPQLEQLQAEFHYPSGKTASGSLNQKIEEATVPWQSGSSMNDSARQKQQERQYMNPQYPNSSRLQPNLPQDLFKGQSNNSFLSDSDKDQKSFRNKETGIQKLQDGNEMPEFLKKDLKIPVFKEESDEFQSKSENQISLNASDQMANPTAKELEFLANSDNSQNRFPLTGQVTGQGRQTGLEASDTFNRASFDHGNEQAENNARTEDVTALPDADQLPEGQDFQALNQSFPGGRPADGKEELHNEKSSVSYPSGQKPAVQNGTSARNRGNEFFRHLRVIGQLKDSYILCEGDDGLVIIDQHAAAERCNFEKIEREFEKPVQIMQPLMIPLRLPLSTDLMVQLDTINEKVRPYGLNFEPFSHNTVLLREEPAWLSLLEREQFFDDLFTWFKDHKDVDMKELRRHLIATCACHSSVRFHHSLCKEEMEKIIADLAAARQPYHCPHGRPTVVTMSLRELAKEFERG